MSLSELMVFESDLPGPPQKDQESQNDADPDARAEVGSVCKWPQST